MKKRSFHFEARFGKKPLKKINFSLIGKNLENVRNRFFMANTIEASRHPEHSKYMLDGINIYHFSQYGVKDL